MQRKLFRTWEKERARKKCVKERNIHKRKAITREEESERKKTDEVD